MKSQTTDQTKSFKDADDLLWLVLLIFLVQVEDLSIKLLPPCQLHVFNQAFALQYLTKLKRTIIIKGCTYFIYFVYIFLGRKTGHLTWHFVVSKCVIDAYCCLILHFLLLIMGNSTLLQRWASIILVIFTLTVLMSRVSRSLAWLSGLWITVISCLSPFRHSAPLNQPPKQCHQFHLYHPLYKQVSQPQSDVFVCFKPVCFNRVKQALEP